MHIFFVCSKAIECWDKIGITNIIRELLLGANNFYAMLFDLFTRLKEKYRLSPAMTLWSLWMSQNAKLWDLTNTTPTSIINRAHEYYMNGVACKKLSIRCIHKINNCAVWIKPQPGYIKCNVDAPSSIIAQPWLMVCALETQ
jgi:hypothetical protein